MRNNSNKKLDDFFTELISVENYSDFSPREILAHLPTHTSLDLGKIEGINKSLLIDSVDIAIRTNECYSNKTFILLG